MNESEYETFAMGALEAAACGTPIFSYPVKGGINEWLRQGNGGVISNKRTPASLAEQTANVLKDIKKWQSLRSSARTIASQFTEDNMANKTILFYQEILKNVKSQLVLPGDISNTKPNI